MLFHVILFYSHTHKNTNKLLFVGTRKKKQQQMDPIVQSKIRTNSCIFFSHFLSELYKQQLTMTITQDPFKKHERKRASQMVAIIIEMSNNFDGFDVSERNNGYISRSIITVQPASFSMVEFFI